jgi:hypothetical protein
MSQLVLQPMSIGEARAFVRKYHRHHSAPVGGLFAVGVNAQSEVVLDEQLRETGEDCVVVGVAIVGRPVARMLQDGWTAEVTRLCTLGDKNAPSMLYAACWRAARALGYRWLITYILAREPGTSVLAAGWRLVGAAGGGSWSRKSRPRVDTHPLEQKQLWEVVA